MIAQLRARLHGLQRGRQTYFDNETATYILAAVVSEGLCEGASAGGRAGALEQYVALRETKVPESLWSWWSVESARSTETAINRGL